MNTNNFHYISVLLDIMYGIEIEDEDMEELGLQAWDLIGNKNTRLYSFQCTPNSENAIELPCNAVSVEAVTTSFEDWNRSTNKSPNGDWNSAFVENWIEGDKTFKSPYYVPGKLISYEQTGNTLYFPKNYFIFSYNYL